MNDVLLSLFADVLQVDVAQVNDDSSPDNLPQWDSLAAMGLVVAIEEAFDVELSTKEIMKMTTVGIARQTLREKDLIKRHSLHIISID